MIAGREYLRRQTLDERRASGRVYTPLWLVHFVLERAGYAAHAEVETMPLLDPACGAGAFLEQAAMVLHGRLKSIGRASYDQLALAIEANLWGVDSDPEACELTRTTLRGVVERMTGQRPPIEFFRKNVVLADFLFDESLEKLPPIQNGRLRFVIGNPPYVSATRIETGYKKQLRAKFAAAGGRIDLYAVFLERSLALLPPGGRASFITPDKFLKSYSARGLRTVILERSAVRTIALFSAHDIFEDAAIVPCVIVLERSGTRHPVQVIECGYRSDRARVDTIQHRTIDHSSLGIAPWRLHSADLSAFLSRIRADHPRLKDLALRISAGPATGRDSLFLFGQGDPCDIEESLLRSAIRGRDIAAYQVIDPRLKLLLPYVYDEIGRPRPIGLADYPKAGRYLRERRGELSARHCVRTWGREWYGFHDLPLTDLTKHAKILVPDIANSNRFAVDTGNFFPLHSAYYVLPKAGLDLDYAVAVLNSSVASFLIRSEAPVVKDGFNRYRQQFLMTLPLPIPSRVVMSNIGRAVRRGDFAEADILVQRLFGLTDEEQASIQARLFPRLAA